MQSYLFFCIPQNVTPPFHCLNVVHQCFTTHTITSANKVDIFLQMFTLHPFLARNTSKVIKFMTASARLSTLIYTFAPQYEAFIIIHSHNNVAGRMCKNRRAEGRRMYATHRLALRTRQIQRDARLYRSAARPLPYGP